MLLSPRKAGLASLGFAQRAIDGDEAHEACTGAVLWTDAVFHASTSDDGGIFYERLDDETK